MYGDDYQTPDGTNIRDYVHIIDLAEAHILALAYMKDGKPSTAFNLGSSQGYLVKEILENQLNSNLDSEFAMFINNII